MIRSTPKITPRQQQILDTIAEFVAEFGFPPTMRELGDRLDIASPNGVRCHILALANKGYIEHYPSRSRGIALVDRTRSGVSYAGQVANESISVRGRAPAGTATEAIEDGETTLNLAANYGSDSFWLEVDGDSMIDAGIDTGDMVLVQRRYDPHYDQIVVADIDGEVTVKRWCPVDGGVCLRPANPNHKSRFSMDASVIGVVKAILKTV